MDDQLRQLERAFTEAPRDVKARTAYYAARVQRAGLEWIDDQLRRYFNGCTDEAERADIREACRELFGSSDYPLREDWAGRGWNTNAKNLPQYERVVRHLAKKDTFEGLVCDLGEVIALMQIREGYGHDPREFLAGETLYRIRRSEGGFSMYPPVAVNAACDYGKNDYITRNGREVRKVRWIVNPAGFRVKSGVPVSDLEQTNSQNYTFIEAYEVVLDDKSKEYQIEIPDNGYALPTCDGMFRPDTGTPFATSHNEAEVRSSGAPIAPYFSIRHYGGGVAPCVIQSGRSNGSFFDRQDIINIHQPYQRIPEDATSFLEERT